MIPAEVERSLDLFRQVADECTDAEEEYLAARKFELAKVAHDTRDRALEYVRAILGEWD